MKPQASRRAFLGATAFSALLGGLFRTGRANSGPPKPAGAPKTGHAPDMDGAYSFEVTHPEVEWRARLTKEEFHILREKGTELPETSATWNRFDDGTYSCRGCDLKLYDSPFKVDVNLGWNFFQHSAPNAVLTGIDPPVAAYGQPMGSETKMIEVHCRRCGSHLGHLLRVARDPLHCINGKALVFSPTPA